MALRPWRVVFGFEDEAVDRAAITARFRELASKHHPDKGGADASDAAMSAVNVAYDAALQEITQ